MFSVKVTKSVLINTIGKNNKLKGINEIYLYTVIISELFNNNPIRKISIANNNCVTTFDKLAKKPYFQKVKSIHVNFTDLEKLMFNFFIKNITVSAGVNMSERIYPFSL